MHIGRGRLDSHVLMAQLKDFTRPQSHLDHEDPDIPEHRGRTVQVFSFLIERKRSFPSLFMQELHPSSKERTLLDQILLHSNIKNLPQARQIAVNRRGTGRSEWSCLSWTNGQKPIAIPGQGVCLCV